MNKIISINIDSLQVTEAQAKHAAIPDDSQKREQAQYYVRAAQASFDKGKLDMVLARIYSIHFFLCVYILTSYCCCFKNNYFSIIQNYCCYYPRVLPKLSGSKVSR